MHIYVFTKCYPFEIFFQELTKNLKKKILAANLPLHYQTCLFGVSLTRFIGHRFCVPCFSSKHHHE